MGNGIKTLVLGLDATWDAWAQVLAVSDSTLWLKYLGPRDTHVGDLDGVSDCWLHGAQPWLLWTLGMG